MMPEGWAGPEDCDLLEPTDGIRCRIGCVLDGRGIGYDGVGSHRLGADDVPGAVLPG